MVVRVLQSGAACGQRHWAALPPIQAPPQVWLQALCGKQPSRGDQAPVGGLAPRRHLTLVGDLAPREHVQDQQWQQHLAALNAIFATYNDGSSVACSRLRWSDLWPVYHPVMVEDKSQFPLAEVDCARFKQVLHNLLALDRAGIDPMGRSNSEALTSEFVHAVLQCVVTMLDEEDTVDLQKEAQLKTKAVLASGFADYLLSRGGTMIMVVEVKKNDLEGGRLQAAVLADIARAIDREAGPIFAVVTTLSRWVLMKRTASTLHWCVVEIRRHNRNEDAMSVASRLYAMLQSGSCAPQPAKQTRS